MTVYEVEDMIRYRGHLNLGAVRSNYYRFGITQLGNPLSPSLIVKWSIEAYRNVYDWYR